MAIHSLICCYPCTRPNCHIQQMTGIFTTMKPLSYILWVIYVHLNVKEQYIVIWNVRSYVVCSLHWNNRKQHKQKFVCITHQLVSNVLLCHSSINTLFSIGEGSMNYVSVKTKSIMTVDKSQTGKRDYLSSNVNGKQHQWYCFAFQDYMLLKIQVFWNMTCW